MGRLMKSAGKLFYSAGLSRHRELTEWLLKLGLEAYAPFSTMESVRKSILNSAECAAAWSRFLRPQLGTATSSTLLEGEGRDQDCNIHQSKTSCFNEEFLLSPQVDGCGPVSR
jgi:hypothetical protein